jgi:uncharacterized membrane protein YbhN (UPF0104 family)
MAVRSPVIGAAHFAPHARAVPDNPPKPSGPTSRAGWSRLGKRAIKVLGYLVLGYLLYRLFPTLKQSVRTLEHVHWQWIVGAVGLEVLSEFGYVLAWRTIVDPERLLSDGGQGTRTATRAAWAQLGGGYVMPGGSLTSIGVGAWILRRFGMPFRTIAERQFNLSFLNTSVDALALIVCGAGLGLGIFSGGHKPLLTWLPAGVAVAGIGGALLLARSGAKHAKSLEPKHPRLAGSIGALAAAVRATQRILFHRSSRRSLAGALAYLGFDALVLWTAFLAIHAHPVPSFAVVVMAYIIGALGASIPLPAGVGAIGGIAGMLVVYGVAHAPAIAAVLLYEAVGLLVPVAGGGVAYLLLRRRFGPMKTRGSDDAVSGPPPSAPAAEPAPRVAG